ncbi:MAG: glycosyltransferase family 2 protein [Solirubrobacteraceae bacterium]
MAPSVDVVIPAFNRYDLTASCLRHLAPQSLPHRTIVVDNGSTDGTPERLAADWPEAEVVLLGANPGFSAACNRGAAAGRGDVVVLLNNDVDCRPDFLERLIAPLVADPRLGSVAALMLVPGERTIDSIGLSADVTLAGFPRLHGLAADRAGEPRPLLSAAAGTAAAYRRTAWVEAGGLDERMFAYLEDFDLGLRLRAAGWGCGAAPDAVGVHLGSATHGHRTAAQRRHGGFSRGYMLRRYGVLRGRFAARTLVTEAIVVAGDLLISRDLAALGGRLAGWRAGGGAGPLPSPPAATLDRAITLRGSLALRRGVYAPQPR